MHNSSPPHIHRCDHAFFRRKCACRIKTSTPPSKHPRSKESKRRNPSFEFRPHQTSKPASSHPRPRNPGFGIQASNFGCIKPPSRLHSIHVHGIHASKSTLPISAASNLLLPTRRLCRIHVHGIQASDFDLFGNRCDRRTIAFLFYTFVGNDGRRASALTRRKVGARAFTRSARSHLACPLPQSY